MKYVTVDGMFSGTGVRDAHEGRYIDPQELGLSSELILRISHWLNQYEDAHYMQYQDKNLNEELDSEGLNICLEIMHEIPNIKVEYYSNAYTKRIPIKQRET